MIPGGHRQALRLRVDQFVTSNLLAFVAAALLKTAGGLAFLPVREELSSLHISSNPADSLLCGVGETR